jgi:hypothetical protein
LVLAYLRTAGLEDVIDRMVAAAPPAFTIHRDDRAAGLKYVSAHEGNIFEFLARVDRALSVAPHARAADVG